ncbi:MAG: methanogenesis marker 16 metalloprotein [Methanosphaera sp.]|nr:methanogenesis marker 16 metalloprotein [Methanosphaera sp.]
MLLEWSKITKTIEEIKEKLDSNDAIVLTAQELKNKIHDGEDVTIDDVDVVTCSTSGVMSGTTALLHIPVTEPGVFNKAEKVYINGVESYPGPCPNELLGSIDVIVYGTNHSQTIENYAGGSLIKDLLDHKEVDVQVFDTEGNEFNKTVTIDDIETARIIGTRMAFKNYNSFTNPSKKTQKSIFNATPMEGPFNSYSFSGCGDINPLQNDPEQEVINVGTKVLLNGAEGIIVGNGTRSQASPNLSIVADMKDMDPYYVGGFNTGLGPDVYDSVAIPIPVLNDSILNNLKVLNKDITLPVKDIHGRHLPIDEVDYSIWDDAQLRPTVDPDSCFNCIPCLAEIYCPVGAYKDHAIDEKLCYGCGNCVTVCPRGVPSMDMGSVKITSDGKEHTIPVTCRQSDKKRAMDLGLELKNRLLDKTFKL